jgi:CRISPR system Cascade subunit CasD
MQSWGHHAKFSERDTALEPTKSGIIGLLCAALGRERDEDISDLNALKMAVRVEREGIIKKDYHTILGTIRADGSPNNDTVISNRYYLSDACFLVLLEGNEKTLAIIREALSKPKWALYLGRKSFPLSNSILVIGLATYSTIDDALRTIQWLGKRRNEDIVPERLRVVIECSNDEGTKKLESPLGFRSRTYDPRYTKVTWVTSPRISGGE